VISDDILLGDRFTTGGLDVIDEFQGISLDEIVTVKDEQVPVDQFRG
jgi:hypothetical protein